MKKFKSMLKDNRGYGEVVVYFGVIILIVIIYIFTLVYKGSTQTTVDTTTINSENSPFAPISKNIVYGITSDTDNDEITESYDNYNEDTIFAYDRHTHIIYYLFTTSTYDGAKGYHTCTYFSEYKNENGKTCKYDPKTKTISEIPEGNTPQETSETPENE